MTPKQAGFRMPAEWELHDATWIAWPHNAEDWPGRFEPIPWVYGEIVRKLSAVERVRILVQDDHARQEAQAVLTKVGAELAAVEFFPVPTDRVWTRDFAPSFVTAPSPAPECAAVKWHFNAWAKYDDWHRDDAAGRLIPHLLDKRWWSAPIVLEGGSIEVNGQGWAMTTEECLLSPIQARNPGLSREQIEATLSDYLGVGRVLWLRNGIAGDDTHGHIDDLARFVDPDTIVIASEPDRGDPNYEPLRENREILKQYPFRVIELPMPSPVIFDGQRLPASYANFYLANGIALVPTFNDPNDRIALNILAEAMPGRRIIGINCTELILGLGTLHCMTQQQPSALPE
jgi:agmatine deiminase